MESIKKLDKSLEKTFKDMPHLPESTRTGLANIWPWFVLIGGILQLLAAWSLMGVANWANRVSESLASYYNVSIGPSSLDKTVIYLGVIVLIVEAVIMLMAFPKLQKKQRAGWDLLLLAAVVNVLYAVLQIVTFNRGFGSFIFGLLGTVIGLYFLYELKPKFTAK